MDQLSFLRGFADRGQKAQKVVDGILARDAALERVTRKRFMIRGTRIIEDLEHGREMSGEDIRHAVSRLGVKPHHHNAWGALIMNAVRLKLILPTGRDTKMKDRRSHARKTPIYRII